MQLIKQHNISLPTNIPHNAPNKLQTCKEVEVTPIKEDNEEAIEESQSRPTGD